MFTNKPKLLKKLRQDVEILTIDQFWGINTHIELVKGWLMNKGWRTMLSKVSLICLKLGRLFLSGFQQEDISSEIASGHSSGIDSMNGVWKFPSTWKNYQFKFFSSFLFSCIYMVMNL